MAAIPVSVYQNIASYYTSAQQQVSDVSSYYYSAAQDILVVDQFDPELDLLKPFYQAYQGVQSAYLQVPQSVVQAVSSLQSHILAKAVDATDNQFSDINDWIAGTGGRGNGETDQAAFTVSQEFADLSAQAGYEIENTNIA